MANFDNATKALLKFFRITFKKDPQSINKTPFPGHYDSEFKSVKPISMSTDVQRMYKEWANDLTTSQELENRIQRYSDLDFAEKNSGYLNLAIRLYSNETINPDESGKILNVYAKDKKVEQYIYEFFDRIGVNRSVLENTSYDIAKFADSFWVRSISADKGIEEIIPISPYQISKRIEFSALEELRKLTKDFTYMNAYQLKLADLGDILSDKLKNNDYTQMFRRYLFGFGLEGNKLVLPPWAVSHFRRFSTQSEFAPFGRPLLINSISLFREWKSSQNLLALARVAKFPKEVFKIKVDENMTPTERMIAINEARQEYLNFVEIDNGKEDVGIGASIWTAMDTFEYELLSNSMDLGDIADIQLLQNELIASTLIPKGYLITGSEGGWGDAGKALLQQSKVFAREVYVNQTAILVELTDLVKTQFVLMGLFDGEETEFQLSLAYPVTEQSSDGITIQKDTMELANAVMDNLKTALAIDSIPPEVASDILQKYAGFDSKDINSWMKQIKASVDLEIKQAPEFEEPEFKENKQKKISKSLSRLSEDIFRESFFDAKRKLGLTEGVIKGEHFMFTPNLSKTDEVKYMMMKENYGLTKRKIEE
jgi:hypothetical protein